VTAGPGDEMAAAAAGRGRLRASHADREQVIDMLKAAFVQERLTKDELDVRVGQTFASRTYADLAAVTADIPAWLIAAPPPRQPARARARPPVGKVVAGATLIIPPPAMVAAVFLTGNEQLAKLFMLVIPWFLVAWIVAGLQMLDSRQKRSRGPLPPRPAQPGQALEGEQHGTTGDDLILSEVHGDAPARHLPGHGVIQRSRWSRPVRRDQRPAGLPAGHGLTNRTLPGWC